MINKSKFWLGLNASCVCLSLFMYADRVYAQSANQSTVTNSAAPNAISTTTGGSNLTYQSNNAYNNEFGFGPGIFCRTPALFISGNLNNAESDNYYSGATTPLPVSSNDNFNYGGSIGIVIPFGSSIQEYCKSVARQTAVDREVSTQLSMIRACAALIKEGIRVDPDKFPLLSPCVVNEGQPLLYIGTPGSPNPQANLPPVGLSNVKKIQNERRIVNNGPRTPIPNQKEPNKIPKLSGG